ncbi:MAG: hypothetical protein HY983_03585 [Candidatus Magasanikbacteria bacterium]|nr:hypothetical protein [Candidatus Magasanikbacteria bacterium]
MRVLIEVTAKEQMVLWYETGGEWKKTLAVPLQRNAAVAAVAKLFAAAEEPLSAVTGIGLRVESRRFTTVRLAATIANTLAFALRVPVVGAPPRCSLEELRSLLDATEPGRYVLPEYQAPPRLGGAKIK